MVECDPAGFAVDPADAALGAVRSMADRSEVNLNSAAAVRMDSLCPEKFVELAEGRSLAGRKELEQLRESQRMWVVRGRSTAVARAQPSWHLDRGSEVVELECVAHHLHGVCDFLLLGAVLVAAVAAAAHTVQAGSLEGSQVDRSLAADILALAAHDQDSGGGIAVDGEAGHMVHIAVELGLPAVVHPDDVHRQLELVRKPVSAMRRA